MSGTILLNLYHIICILVGLLTVNGVVYRLIVSRLRNEWKQDFENKLKEVSDKVSEERIRKISTEECDKQINNIDKELGEIKEMLAKLQETVFVIHTSITEMKPKIDNLEKGVDRLEDRFESKKE